MIEVEDPSCRQLYEAGQKYIHSYDQLLYLIETWIEPSTPLNPPQPGPLSTRPFKHQLQPLFESLITEGLAIAYTEDMPRG